MMNDMMSVMNRINELKKRFGLATRPNNNQISAKNNKNFHDELKSSIQTKPIETSENKSKILSRDQINEVAMKVASKEGVPYKLIKAVIDIESSYNQNAISPKGAMGLMQLMPKTAENLGVKDPFSVEENIRGGSKLLKTLLTRYKGDYKKTLAAYNAGEKAVEKYDGIPPYKETKGYVKKVINSYMKN